MKILIIRFSSIGDIVLTTPVIRCVKKQFPQAEIHFLTKQKFLDVVKNNPYISKVYTIIDDTQPVMTDLIRENYTWVIDLHRNLRTWYVKSILRQVFNSQVKTFTFSKLNFRKWLLTNFKINTLPDKSIVDRYFEAIRKTGVKNDGQGLDYFIDESEELQKDDLPFSHVLGFVACVIGGQHATKKMPLAKWADFCKALDFPMIILGGKEDAAQGEELSRIDSVKIYNACGKFSLNESAAIVRKSRFVITHDTGLMHIASAFQKPVISIWGNTVPAFGMFPYYGFNNLRTNVSPRLYLIENKTVSCRPCSKLGYSKCPKGHFNCMQKIPVDVLLEKARALIAELKK